MSRGPALSHTRPACTRCGSTTPAARVVDEDGSEPWCGLCLMGLLLRGERGTVALTVMVSPAETGLAVQW